MQIHIEHFNFTLLITSMTNFRKLMALCLLCILQSFSLFADTHDKTLLVIGDSLSAAYGISRDHGWVNLLRNKQEMRDYRVVNASISGETTRAGLQRLPAALKQYKPSIVIIELGANDGLRGISLQEMTHNLEQMVLLVKGHQAKILLLGIKIPPNYGPLYTRAFEKVFVDLAHRERVLLLPFFLDGIADKVALMQADGLHPTAEAQPKLLNNVWPELSKLF